MPQGRRKVPFSGKAKKEQLQHKRQLRMAETARKYQYFLNEKHLENKI